MAATRSISLSSSAFRSTIGTSNRRFGDNTEFSDNLYKSAWSFPISGECSATWSSRSNVYFPLPRQAR